MCNFAGFSDPRKSNVSPIVEVTICCFEYDGNSNFIHFIYIQKINTIQGQTLRLSSLGENFVIKMDICGVLSFLLSLYLILGTLYVQNLKKFSWFQIYHISGKSPQRTNRKFLFSVECTSLATPTLLGKHAEI